jgi:predicted  nucleic acid-binding Zn-ribbon protein
VPPGFGGRDSAISQALADLQTAAADAKTSPEQLQQKVAAVRAARQKARAKLEAAVKELLEVVAPDQEAVLVGLGYID